MVVTHHFEQGFHSTSYAADDGCVLIEGYDMDTTEWRDEVPYSRLMEYLINNWNYLSMSVFVISNARGEVLRLDN